MNVLVSGGTGLVGQSLIPKLIAAQYQVYVIGRDKNKILHAFKSGINALSWDELDTLASEKFDFIINLAGSNIADHRWSEAYKETLVSSRLKTTARLIQWVSSTAAKKPHLFNASAVSIYGLQHHLNDEAKVFDEQSEIRPQDPHFASQLIQQWEHAALEATRKGLKVSLLRFAVVLKKEQGMLGKLVFPSKMGLSSILGSGAQPLAWIASTDLVRAILFLLERPELEGPFNLSAPEHVNQKTFSRTLARLLKRPCIMYLPRFIVSLLFGQMGQELLLAGQTVQPKRLIDLQFKFLYPTLQSALKKELS